MNRPDTETYYDTYTVGIYLGLDSGLRSQRVGKNHLSLRERVSRRVRRLIKNGELSAVYIDGVGYRVSDKAVKAFERRAKKNARGRTVTNGDTEARSRTKESHNSEQEKKMNHKSCGE